MDRAQEGSDVLSARLTHIEYALPANAITNDDLATRFPAWPITRIAQKTRIVSRRVSAPDQCASDLAVEAAEKLISCGIVSASKIDFVLFCTQSPDYLIPTTACLIHRRLGIPSSAGAVDVNLGCSGYVYALGICDGLIHTRQARNILLLTGDTYSKYVDPDDKNTVLLFGDGASASLIQAVPSDRPLIGPFVYGTDGGGWEHLVLPGSGARRGAGHRNDASGITLRMDGNKLFQFAVERVPECVHALLEKAGLTLEAIDLLILHQANDFILEEISRRLGISRTKMPFEAMHSANTVSSTIPIALRSALNRGAVKEGAQIMLVGYGVGLSWSATILRWQSVECDGNIQSS